ncbi:MAG: MerR family DNA-binding protein [Deltaproteobacteria bacterium]|nr:MerR family DNA-binding protein [Deltaproteobacteria bacterium]
MNERLTIGRVAETAGVNVETIRFYEREGMLEQPERPLRGFRTYPREAIKVVRFIKRAQALGFTLKETSELLALKNTATMRCGEVRARAEAKRVVIRARIKDLARIDRALSELVETCARKGGARCCPIIEALGDGKKEEQ